MRVIWITVLAMIGSVSIQPILAVYLSELAGDPERATTVSGIIFALPGLALMLTANLWVQQGQKRGYGKVVQAALLGAGLLGVALALSRSLVVSASSFSFRARASQGFAQSLRPSSPRRSKKSFAAVPLGSSKQPTPSAASRARWSRALSAPGWGAPAVFAVIGVSCAGSAVPATPGAGGKAARGK